MGSEWLIASLAESPIVRSRLARLTKGNGFGPVILTKYLLLPSCFVQGTDIILHEEFSKTRESYCSSPPVTQGAISALKIVTKRLPISAISPIRSLTTRLADGCEFTEH